MWSITIVSIHYGRSAINVKCWMVSTDYRKSATSWLTWVTPTTDISRLVLRLGKCRFTYAVLSWHTTCLQQTTPHLGQYCSVIAGILSLERQSIDIKVSLHIERWFASDKWFVDHTCCEVTELQFIWYA